MATFAQYSAGEGAACQCRGVKPGGAAITRPVGLRRKLRLRDTAGRSGGLGWAPTGL